MKEYVIDASVAIKWYIPEPLGNAAVRYLTLQHSAKARLLAPDLLIPEAGNVLCKKYCSGELTQEETRLIAESLSDNSALQLISSKQLLPAALEISLACGLTVYDSLYLALAVTRRATLVTADKKLAEAASSTFGPGTVTLLSLTSPLSG